MIKKFFLFLLLLGVNELFAQFPPAAGITGTTAIHKDSSIISGWAISCNVYRGFINLEDTTATFSLGGVTSNRAFAGADSLALGYPENAGSVSLGDGGYAIVSFSKAIKNGEGPDFAIFENGFPSSVPPYQYFLELAFVEVSSDGENYVRFPSYSLTQDTLQIETYGQINPEEIHNLAGKYVSGYGTPFDLEELKDSPGLDVNSVTHIKIIDVCGSINDGFASYDSEGRIINDPFPTAFAAGGFDLNAVAAINLVNNDDVGENFVSGDFDLFPNPVMSGMKLKILLSKKQNQNCSLSIINLSGIEILSKNLQAWEREVVIQPNLPKGIYIVNLRAENELLSKKLVIQ